MKRKGYSIINVFGLATGMAVCLLIVLFIQSEVSYDKYQGKGDNIYRTVLERRYPGRTSSYALIPQSIGGAIKKEHPEVLESTRLFNFGNPNFFMRVDDKVYEEQNAFAVDSNFFRVFTGEFLFGDVTTALMLPNSVVLSEATAIKMYGSAEQAIGKQFQTDGDENNTFRVTGVCKDWPANSHFSFNVLLSAISFPFTREPNYVGFSAYTYLLLHPNANPDALEVKFPAMIEKYVAGEIGRQFGQSFKNFQAAGNGYHYYLQPLRKIHLTSDLEAELAPNGNINSIYIFGIIAVFILFLACINFVNLSTARSVERAREVGIRKTFGSGKKALIGQFLVESMFISIAAFILAFGLMFILLPLFNDIAGKNLTVQYFFQPVQLSILFLFAIVVGIVAGLYPAFVLSSFKPTLVLKGRFKSNKQGLVLRNSLVVFQFAISVILIISAIIVNQQMKYMLSGNLGFKKDHIITIDRADLLQNRVGAFKTELSKIPGVERASATSSVPGLQNFFGITFQKSNSRESLTGRGIVADEDYAKTLDLELKQGRFFSSSFGTDTLSVVLNEKAVQELGLTDPIGARLTTLDNNFNAPDGSSYTYRVVGVLKDFHFQSLHQTITPLIFINAAKFEVLTQQVAVRIKGDNFSSSIKTLENLWKQFVNDRALHYTFLDQTIAAQYESEQTTQRIFTTFSSLAIFIACIGLLGLVAYTTQQRTKEISIRKVLGASAASILGMLSKDFLKLVTVASIIGFPLAWWAMSKWLEDFAYRVNISLWVFVAAAFGALAIALITISFQSIKAAISNPAKNLRSE